MPEYYVVDVDESELESVYFLVRAVSPETTMADWLAQVPCPADDGGILGLQSRSGMLFGLLAFRKQNMLRHGPTLTVERLIALDLGRSGAGKKLLLDAAQHKAESLGCFAIAYNAREVTIVHPAVDR